MVDQLSSFRELEYSGRAVHAGLLDSNEFVLGYTVTGRSPFSQARRFRVGECTGNVYVTPVNDNATLMRMFNLRCDNELNKLKADIAKGVEQFSDLIYYPAMRPVRERKSTINGVAVSNGWQTNLVHAAIISGLDDAEECLNRAFRFPFLLPSATSDKEVDVTSYEPDAPNFTPRVQLALVGDDIALSIIRKGRTARNYGKDVEVTSIPFTYHRLFSLPTYKGGNESPLLPFEGDLIEDHLSARTAEGICESLYAAIMKPNPKDGNKVYGVAAAVMIPRKNGTLETAIINRADRC